MNLASIVWLYRGETGKFQELRERYERAHDLWRDGEVTNGPTGKTYKGIAVHRERLSEAFRALASKLRDWSASIEDQLTDEAKAALVENARMVRLESLRAISAEALGDKKAVDERFKAAEDAVTFADKVLRPSKDKTFNKTDIRGALKRLSDEREDFAFVLERIAFFKIQTAWLDTNFPDGAWRDVEGLCKISSSAEIAEKGFSLNPGRYVGMRAEDDGMSEAEFCDFMETSADSLARLHTEADEIQKLIAEDIKALSSAAKAETV